MMNSKKSMQLVSAMLWIMCIVSDEIACSSPAECNSQCENDDGCTNIAYPLLVIRLLPGGRPMITQHFKVMQMLMTQFLKQFKLEVVGPDSRRHVGADDSRHVGTGL